MKNKIKNRKKNKMKETGNGLQTQLPWSFWLPPTTCIFFQPTPNPQGGRRNEKFAKIKDDFEIFRRISAVRNCQFAVPRFDLMIKLLRTFGNATQLR